MHDLTGNSETPDDSVVPDDTSSSQPVNDANLELADATKATDERVEIDEEAALLKAIDEIDYSAYENPELRAAIEAILSVPQTLIFFLRVVILTFPLCQLVISWSFHEKSWLTLGVAVLAGFLASLLLAVLLGITLCLRRILNEVVRVIDKTLDIVGAVISDLGTTKDKGMIMTIACVFGGVSRNLILPIVESVVKSQLGFLGWPLLWVYRRVFVRAVDAATNRILLASSKIQVPGKEAMAPTAAAVGQRVKSGAETANRVLAAVRPYAVGGTRALALGILIPAWLLLGLVTAAIIGIFWFGHWMT